MNHNILLIAKLISENIDDLEYDGPEETEEFSNTYFYTARCDTGKVDDKWYEFYVRIINDNTIELSLIRIESQLGYLTEGEGSGRLQYDPKTQKCNWVTEDISMLSKRLASEILRDFEKMMQGSLRNLRSGNHKTLAKAVSTMLEIAIDPDHGD